METVETEVGQKMRSAIKAKLKEIGCYVDDELPDYIMVMIANQRSKSQMVDDLRLFLRKDTKLFVDWLHSVLKKLKEVTVTNPHVKQTYRELKRKATLELIKHAQKKQCSDNTNLNDTFDIPRLSEMDSNKKKDNSISKKNDSEDEDFINIRADVDELEIHTTEESMETINEGKVVSVIHLPKHSPVREKKPVRSVVRVKSRVFTPPKPCQASKKLLLRAVAEAEKSVMQQKVMGILSPPVPELEEPEDPIENLVIEVKSKPIEPIEQKFVVTLDDIEKKPPSPIIFESKKPKDRCKFWPNCRLKNQCEFIHPSTICNAFPVCKFGEKCLYIHPKCKFDSLCTKTNCPFTHTNPKHINKFLEICKYFPNCTNQQCQYFHPKLCKFGTLCTSKNTCAFFHPKLANNQFKWRQTSTN